MARTLVPWHVKPIGFAIRIFLQYEGRASAYDFYREYKEYRNLTYNTVLSYFGMLKKGGLIVHVETVEGRGRYPRKLYSLVKRRLTDSLWKNPQGVWG